MAVYLTLTVLVVALGLLANNRDYVKLHIVPAGQSFCPGRKLTRQQAFNIVVMVAIFALLAGVSACRIAVGNDYWIIHTTRLKPGS